MEIATFIFTAIGALCAIVDTAPKIIAWIQSKRMEVVVSSASPSVWRVWLPLFLGVVAFVFSTLGLYRLFGNDDNSSQVPTALSKLADSDAAQIPNLLVIVSQFPRMHLDALEPYVDMEISVVNASVFEITSEGKSEGYVRYHDQPLLDKPTVLLSGFPLAHGKLGKFIIRQPVSPKVAREISEEILKKKKPMADVGRLSIFFSYKDRLGRDQVDKWGMGGFNLYVPE